MSTWEVISSLISIGLSVLWVVCCVQVATQKGYSPVLAGCMGCLFGWIALLIYHFVLPDTGMGSSDGVTVPKGPPSRTPRNTPPHVSPGVCRVCGYQNGARDSRCFQCGNTLF